MKPKQPLQELEYQQPELNEEQAEEIKKKRLERFGPVEQTDPNQSSAPKVEKATPKTRCRHFPNCKKTESECPYLHPTEECKFFPKCTYGDKCLFIHPETLCKYADACNRMNCAFKHSKQKQQMIAFNPLMMMQQMPMMFTSF